MPTRWPAGRREVGHRDRRAAVEPAGRAAHGRPPGSRPDRCATSESSSTLFAPAMPQAWGDEPWPVDGVPPDPGGAGVGGARALPPRQRPALAVGDHEFVVQDPLVSVVARWPARLRPARRCRRSSSSRPGSRRSVSGGSTPAQAAEAVVVGGVDHGEAGPGDRGAEERALPGPVADRRGPVGVLGVVAPVGGVRLQQRAGQVVEVVPADRRLEHGVGRGEEAGVLRRRPTMPPPCLPSAEAM